MVGDFQGKSREDERELEVSRRREIIFERRREIMRDINWVLQGLHFRGRVTKFDVF